MPDDVTPQEGGDEKSRVQKRIDQLTSRRAEAESLAQQEKARADALATQNAELLRQIQNQTGHSRPSPAPAQGAPNDPISEFFGSGSSRSPKDEAPATPDIEGLIESAVGRALAPLVERQQAAEKEAVLHAQQTQSFTQALEFLPNLAEPGTVEQQLFDEILAAQPELRGLPSAPLLVANVVAGIVGNGNAQPSVPTEDKKLAASPPNRGFDLSARLKQADGDGNQVRRNEDAIQNLAAKGRQGGLSSDELEALIGLKMGRANVSE